MNEKKTVLAVTYGPVPTSQYQTIEGGGMRAWGLAQGLKANGFEVTVAVNHSFPQELAEYDGIHLVNWTEDEAFIRLINSFDAVIISYCMGGTSVFVADNIADDVTLILDAYVPIYIEVAARDSEDKRTELENYEVDMANANHTLRRGDYFLCANIPQKHMYTGILSSMGIINPVTYGDERVLVVPFGIGSEPLPKLTDKTNPYSKLGVNSDDFVLLWFGGLYPWFNFEPLIQSIVELSKDPHFKFVLVGGKNPFNQNPDFVKQYDFVQESFAKAGLIDKSIYLVDWVDYNDRVLWYEGANVVVSLNQTGEENVYSWRTRVMDYVWGKLPMLTNGGDPLSDELIVNGAAIKIDTDEVSITTTVKRLMEKQNELAKLQANLNKLREKFYWDKVVTPIAEKLQNAPLPYSAFQDVRSKWGLSASKLGSSTKGKTTVGRTAQLRRYYEKAREKGLRRSGKLAIKIGYSLAKSRLRRASSNTGSQKVVLLSHPIDETGAPLVLLDIANDFAEHFTPRNIHIVAPDIKKHLLKPLQQKHFTIHKMAMGLSTRLIHAQLGVQPDDYVLMNTVALYENYRVYVYKLLESNRLKRAAWFIHEDNPKLQFKNKKETARIKSLLERNLLQIFVPSSQTAKDYNEFFGTEHVKSVNLRVTVPSDLCAPRTADSFEKISFVTSGSPWDGRKGQFMLLNALMYFEKKLRNDSGDYRPYDVTLLALGNDYISKQLIATGNAFFGDSFKSFKKLPREEALVLTSKCNLTVCSSLNETFALFVAEGMAMGHPIIRNHSSGWQEQLQEGKNGYTFEDLDIASLADKLETVLNKNKTSNKELAAMGRESQTIAKTFEAANYYSQIYPLYLK